MRIQTSVLTLVTAAGIASAWLATPASAAPARGAELVAAIAGNTMPGAMDGSGPYTVFYADDDTVKGQSCGGDGPPGR